MTDLPQNTLSPRAIMLLSSSCPHCPSVLDSLTKMIKAGDLSALEVINLEQSPDATNTFNARSVPWVKIGGYELTGNQTFEALMQRVEWAKNEDNMATQRITKFDSLLSNGQVNNVIETIKNDESGMDSIMSLLGDTGTVLSTRIGIGVVFEEFSGTDLLKALIPSLGELTLSDDPRIRADAYHYLGITKDKSSIPYLKAGRNDLDKDVQEIANDSLQEIMG